VTKIAIVKRRLFAALSILFAQSTLSYGEASATEIMQNEWVKYSEQANGDLYFYDPKRLEKLDTVRHVWNGIRYKTSLMGAFSSMSLLAIDCENRTEKTLQNTFFSDQNWEQAAMSTNMSESATREIEAGSAMARLAEIVCDYEKL